MRAFVAVVEEGGLSAAARKLHVSQPALSQTVNNLERSLGVRLLVRSSTGVTATEAGTVLLGEARDVLARHDRAVAVMAGHAEPDRDVLRVGVPLELPSDLLATALAELASTHPRTRPVLQHLSTSAQTAALLAGDLDLGLLRERPPVSTLDAALVLEERLGVVLTSERIAALAGPDGVRLDALAGLTWVGFPRSGSPAWYDELTAVLRSHGLDLGPAVPDGYTMLAEVKLAAVSTGGAFTLAPPDWPHPLPDGISWLTLVGHPIVRRTWAVWPAHSRRRDLGALVASLEDRSR